MSAYRQEANPHPELAPYDCVDGKLCPRCGECDWQTAVSVGCPRHGQRTEDVALEQLRYCQIQGVHRHVICWRCQYEIVTESRKAYLERHRAELDQRRAQRRARIRRALPPYTGYVATEWVIVIIVAAVTAIAMLWGGP